MHYYFDNKTESYWGFDFSVRPPYTTDIWYDCSAFGRAVVVRGNNYIKQIARLHVLNTATGKHAYI